MREWTEPNEISASELCSTRPTRMAVPEWFVGAFRLFLSALREIFDESAYSRFLLRNGMTSCPDAYAAFQREQQGIKARRPKCC